jgi:hypothetical protein
LFSQINWWIDICFFLTLFGSRIFKQLFLKKCYFFSCQIDHLAEQGKNYPWPIPGCCPKCNGRIWKHGFTTAYFFPLGHPLYIQRLICPDCKTVFRFRPSGYLPYYSYPLVIIFLELFCKKSLPDKLSKVSVETRKSWLQRLKKQIKLTLMKLKSKDYKKGFLELLTRGFNPISYQPNLKIPPHFPEPTEVHLFSG